MKKLNNKELFKRLWQVGAIRTGTDKHIARSRKYLFDHLLLVDGLQGVGNVTRCELVTNHANLARLMSELTRIYTNSEFEAAFIANYKQLITVDSSVDPIAWLLQKGQNVPRVPTGLIDALLEEYDFELPIGGNFFINTLDHQKPLLLKRVGSMTIIYRADFMDIDSFLLRLYQEAIPYLVYEEPFRFSKMKSQIFKSFILESFTGKRPQEGVKNQTHIVDDAFTDLIKLSNVGQATKMENRIKRLEELRGEFSEHYSQAFSLGFYKPFFSDYEYSQYSTLFDELQHGLASFVPVIYGRIGNPREKIKPYYIFEQLDRERNNLKINESALDREIIRWYSANRQISTYIHQIHPDIKLGLYNLSLHMDLVNADRLYFKGSPFCEVINLIVSKHYRRRPVLVKFLIKDILDQIYHDFKEDGLLMFHQLETLFGYRNSHLIVEEVKDDYMNWFTKDIDKYSDVQAAFIRKWAPRFFEYTNYYGKRIGDIYKRNAGRYTSFNDLLGSATSYMSSSGAVDDFQAMTDTGKSRGISKNQFFNIFQSQEDYMQSLKDRVTPRRNKVIIKREEYIKQRIVINSTLNTFVPLSKLNRFVAAITNGSGVTYFSNTKQQKAEHYFRLQKYLLYNKYVQPRYLALPLDYSSYDHTITMGFIEATLTTLAEYVGYGSEVSQLVQEFQNYLKDEVVYFKELEGLPENNQKYKYGMLSGWKITSSVESLGNAIISFGVAQELKEKLVDFETMGDDLILLYDKANLQRKHQLEFLDKICKTYTDLGFEMNAPKNSVGYYFLEFLRVTFLPGLVQSYPARVLGAISTLKPGRSDQTFGIVEFQAVVKKIIKRYGVTSQYISFAKRVAQHYKKSDIREFGAKYLMNPSQYDIKQKERVEYTIKISKPVDTIPVYRRYLSILGEDFAPYIEKICRDEVLTKKVTVTKVVPTKKKAPPEKWKLGLLRRVVQMIRKDIVFARKVPCKFILPDYHLSSILLEWLSKNKSLDAAKRIFQRVNDKLLDASLIRQYEWVLNGQLLSTVNSTSELFLILREDKLKVDENIIPSIILSRVKQALVQNILKFLSTTNVNEMEFKYLRAILKKKSEAEVQTLLSIILQEGSEVWDTNSGMPIAFRSD